MSLRDFEYWQIILVLIAIVFFGITFYISAGILYPSVL
jgi:hypothetical protein